jgi:hypothetical protein
MKIASIFLALTLFFCGRLTATHIVGGGFHYQHLGGNQYRFTLTLYFDFINGNVGAKDQNAVCHIFRKFDNAYMDSLELDLQDSSSFLAYSNPGCDAVSNLKTQVLTYSRIYFMSDSKYNSAKGYYMIWERCCRNNIITNISEPGATGQTFYMEFPPVFRNGQAYINNSPRFAPVNADFPCANQNFSISYQATDQDGDLLVYTLTNPLKGNSTSTTPRGIRPFPAPYDPVDWEFGYSALTPIIGDPGLSVNSSTGLLSCKASFSGLYVFSVKCEEFRGGVKIGEVRREMQMPVVDCPRNDPPVIVLSNNRGVRLGDDDTLYLESKSEDFCIPLKITDVQRNTNIKFRLSVISGPPGIRDSSLYYLSTNIDSANARFCLPSCSFTPEGQPWKIRLIATDDACTGIESDTLQIFLNIAGKPEPDLKLSSNWQGGNEIRLPELGTITFQVSAEISNGEALFLVPEGNLIGEPGFKVSGPESGIGKLVQDITFFASCDGSQDSLELRMVARSDHCDSVHLKILRYKIFVYSDGKTEITPPNLVTCNKDGRNDFFSVEDALLKVNCKNEFDFIEIFNRWGRRVYYSTDKGFKWYPDNYSEGLYYYSLHFLRRNPISGWVQVVLDNP